VISQVSWQALELLRLIGKSLVEDDILDYGNFDRLHHWIIGELFNLAALLGGLYISLKE